MTLKNICSELLMPEEIKSVIEDAQHVIYLSIVSLWEMAIKVSLSKLELSQSLKDITAEVDKSRIQWLPLASTHIQRLATLQFHHRDPFDRTIIAQGLVEEVTIITKDTIFSDYGVSTQWKNQST